MAKVVEVTDLILRDAHQSLLATRMQMEDMLPVLETLDQCGYWSLECWGGATFDACIRFLNEDPWERLRTMRKHMPNTRTQMLLRGQNLLGYRHYGDEVVERFVDKAAENGMDVFRVFDALNDVRNLEVPIKAVKKAGKHAQGTICYTTSPVHTTQKFVDMAGKLLELGVDSICIKDMAALIKPQPTYDIIKGIKDTYGQDVLVHLHTHATTGVTMVSLMKGVEAGADIIDTSVSSMSLGTGHNPTESFAEMLEGTGYTHRLDLEKIDKVRAHFEKVRPWYREYESAFLVDTTIFQSQIPGGMLSNMESQLKQQGMGDRIREVLEEVPVVRKDAGYPPLVTPSSQIVGTQAVFNVMFGRYKNLSGEFADLMLGYYGETDDDRSPEVIEISQQKTGKEPITCRPADLIKPEWETLRSDAAALQGFDGSDEDVLTCSMFPKVAPSFFKTRPDGPVNLKKDPDAVKPTPGRKPVEGEPGWLPGPVDYTVKLNNTNYKVTVESANS